jgi:hypothetical protein
LTRRTPRLHRREARPDAGDRRVHLLALLIDHDAHAGRQRLLLRPKLRRRLARRRPVVRRQSTQRIVQALAFFSVVIPLASVPVRAGKKETPLSRRQSLG